MKRKSESINCISEESRGPAVDLKEFKVESTLNFQSREKVLIVKGKFKDSSSSAVLILEKSPFPSNLNDFEKTLVNDEYQSENIMQNDIYGTYSISGMNSINKIKVTVINPATEKHILKYSMPQVHCLSESPTIYNTITLPYIMQNQFSTSWVTNLINGTAEEDRVLYRSTTSGFVLALDFKWNGEIKDDLHCLAVGGHDAPHSLRDLRTIHLPLLKEIRDDSIATIAQKYNIPRSQIRLYIHYPPSFYHLHVHVTHLHNCSATALVDRAHLLSTVIRNIEMVDNFYEKATLDITVQDNDPICDLYRTNKCLE